MTGMDWLDEVRRRLRRKNELLFSRDSAVLQPLRDLLSRQDHRTAVLWALDLAEETVARLTEKHPDEQRPAQALQAARAWAAGEIKMLQARRAILACHDAARDMPCPEDAALCHAVGQACAVVHTAGHALGYPIYELTALVRRLGVSDCREAVQARMEEYLRRLMYWETHAQDMHGPWADFMLR